MVALLALGLFVLTVATRRRAGSASNAAGLCRALGSTVGILVAFAIATGPGYALLGIEQGSRAESLGIFLNQMARVAASDGNMSDLDREYMDRLLPLELYRQTYTPCCTDNLKWDKRFDRRVLEKGFLSRWLSMGLRNPKLYIESWVLQTYANWTVNCPEINSHIKNITYNLPRNSPEAYPEWRYKDIVPVDLLKPMGVRKHLTIDEWSVPIGWVFWLLIYSCVALWIRRRPSWTVALLPSLGLIGTLLVAIPFVYWPRYGALLQFLLPFYLAVLCRSTPHEETSC